MQGRAEIVIVGGGPAGLTTALAILHADPSLRERVVVLEKGTYPRDKYCAGALGARGDKILAELDAVPDVPSVPIDGMSFRGTTGERAARVGAIGRVVRRIELDHALSRIATARGVRILDGARVERVEVMAEGGLGGRVTTARETFEAKIVVGADGVGSLVRKAMGLGKGLLIAQVLELDTEPVRQDRPRDLVHFDASDRGFTGYYWDFPTRASGRDLVCRGIYHLRIGHLHPRLREEGDGVDIHQRLAARLSSMGLRIEDSENKRFAERGLAAGERLALGPLMLVGEAAGIDPVTGEGIAQAIEYGALAGPFLASVLRGKESLAGWTRRVNRSRLGVDLRIRRRLVHSFFGPSRPSIERFLVSSPAAVRSGCRHFGAIPADASDLLEVGLGTARVFLESLVRRSVKGGRATSGP